MAENDIRDLNLRRTKIVATVGPATNSTEKLRELITAGANVFRLNFSHGTHQEHQEVYNRIRAVSAEMKTPVGVLQDLSGPKIRITPLSGQNHNLVDGQSVELAFSATLPSDARRIHASGVDPLRVLEPGHQVLLADGQIVLRAEEGHPDHVRCTVLRGGALRSRVGIAFPDSHVDLPATTDKDIVDLQWGLKNGVDFVAISFVQSALDVERVQRELPASDPRPFLIAKIERRAALENIDSILQAADGIMVARGDLGVELPLEQVPLAQKKLISKANYYGKPVIVATQMMHSMINSMRPTRAEVSDIFTAVIEGADALMLSEETAIGSFPIESVSYLSRIAIATEQDFMLNEYKLRLREADKSSVADAVAYAAAAAANKVGAAALIAGTESGNSARLVAKYRPRQPLYGVSRNTYALQRMSLFWGVIPATAIGEAYAGDQMELALLAVQLKDGYKSGERGVITGGLWGPQTGSTSLLQIGEFA